MTEDVLDIAADLLSTVEAIKIDKEMINPDLAERIKKECEGITPGHLKVATIIVRWEEEHPDLAKYDLSKK